MTVYGNF